MWPTATMTGKATTTEEFATEATAAQIPTVIVAAAGRISAMITRIVRASRCSLGSGGF